MRRFPVCIGPVVRLLAVALALTACSAETPVELVAAGKADLAAKNPRAAVVRFKAALQADPKAVQTRVLLAEALLESRDSQGASLELARALEQRADPSTVMPLLARAMLQNNEHKKLVETYGNVNLNDKQAQAVFKVQLATAWGILGDSTKTDAALAEAFAAVPDHPDAVVLQARGALVKANPDQALALVDKLLARDPKQYRAWQVKGEALLAKGADAKLVEEALQKALQVNPEYEQAHSLMVVSKIRRQDLAAARKQLEVFRGVAPTSADFLFLSAQLAYLEKDYQKAKEAVQLLLRALPDNPNLRHLAAAIEWQSGSLVIAQKHLESALREDPSLDEVRTNLAYVYLRLGQPARALAVLEPTLKSGAAKAAALAAGGEAALQLGQIANAESLFARAAQSTPSDPRPRTALAMATLAKGDTATAFAQLESIAPTSSDGYVDSALAAARLQRREFDLALVAVESLLRKTPQAPSAYELKGRVLSAKRDFAGARLAFEKASSLDPRGLPAVVALCELDLLEGQAERARVRAAGFVNADPRNHVALTALADLRLKAGEPTKDVQASLVEAIKIAPEESAARLKLIDLLAKQRQVKAALSAAQEAAAALPNDVQVIDALGRMLWADGKTQQALVTFRKILAIDPNLAVAHTRLAEVYNSEGNLSLAVASLQRALELDHRLRDSRTRLVDLLVDAKRSKQALDIAQDLQRRNPKSPGGYLLEGAVHRKLLDHASSAAAFRRGLQAASDPAELAPNLFVALLADNKWKQAERLAQDWLEKHPDDGAMVYNLAEGYMINQDYGRAETYFARAVTIRPDHPAALNNLASMMVRQGKPGAVEMAERAVRAAPGDPAVMDTLAVALAADKQFPRALELQQKAVALAPAEPVLRLNLAKIARQAGDTKLARSELEKVVALTGRNPVREEAAKLLQSL